MPRITNTRRVLPFCAVLLGVLSACTSPPKLSAVAADAPDNPINTVQSAEALRAKYSR
jgi:hypothetical protein